MIDYFIRFKDMLYNKQILPIIATSRSTGMSTYTTKEIAETMREMPLTESGRAQLPIKFAIELSDLLSEN